MAMYSEKPTVHSVDVQTGRPQSAVYPHHVMLVITVEAKRTRVVEVKLHRIAAELELITGVRPLAVQPRANSRTAVLRTPSWIGPDTLVRMLRARLEQESPSSSMFHFSRSGEPSDSIVAVEATGMAVM